MNGEQDLLALGGAIVAFELWLVAYAACVLVLNIAVWRLLVDVKALNDKIDALGDALAQQQTVTASHGRRLDELQGSLERLVDRLCEAVGVSLKSQSHPAPKPRR